MLLIKFLFSKKATKIEEIFTVDLTLCSKCQIDVEDFVNFCGLFRKHELYRPQARRLGGRQITDFEDNLMHSTLDEYTQRASHTASDRGNLKYIPMLSKTERFVPI